MVRAYVLVSAHPGRAVDVVHALTNVQGVLQADAITGEYDVIAQIEAANIAAVGKLIVDKVQTADGVFKTVTCLAVE